MHRHAMLLNNLLTNFRQKPVASIHLIAMRFDCPFLAALAMHPGINTLVIYSSKVSTRKDSQWASDSWTLLAELRGVLHQIWRIGEPLQRFQQKTFNIAKRKLRDIDAHSVPLFRNTRNCSGLNTVLHSSSDFSTLVAMALIPPARPLLSVLLDARPWNCGASL